MSSSMPGRLRLSQAGQQAAVPPHHHQVAPHLSPSFTLHFPPKGPPWLQPCPSRDMQGSGWM